MKKILKVLSLVLALVMCFTMVFTTAVSAEETTTPTLTIVGQTVEAGAETATIEVVASNFATIAGAHFVVELGALTNVVVDNEFAHYDEAANAVSFVKEAEWLNDECLGFTDDTILTITVAAPAEADSYEVKFGETGKDVDFCTAALEEVAVELVAGAVVVEEAEPEHTCTWDAGVVTTRPTTTETGVRTFTCTECGGTKEEIIPVAVIKADDGTDEMDVYSIGHNLSLESSIKIGFRFRTAFVTEAADVYALVEKDVYDLEGNVVDTVVTTLERDAFEVASSTRYRAFYSGIDSREMGTVVRAEFYRELSDGTFECVLDEYSVSTYAKDSIVSKGPTATLSVMCIDALCYGAASQNNFNYNTANPVTNEISEYLGYATQDCPAYESVTKRVDNPSKSIRLSLNLDLSSQIAIVSNLQNPDKTLYTGDVSTLKAKIVYGFEGSEQTKWIDIEQVEESGVYRVNVNFLTATEMNVPVVISVYDGETLVSDTVTYSVESFASSTFAGKPSTDKLYILMDAVLKYGASAKAYLG